MGASGMPRPTDVDADSPHGRPVTARGCRTAGYTGPALQIQFRFHTVRRITAIPGKRRTAKAFAVDMLLLKFIQGLPVVGVLGGAANPVYYRRIMKYVQLKYRKRYLIKKISEQ